MAEEDGDQVNADHSPPVAKPVCVNGTEGGSLNSKAKAERRSSSSSNPSRKGVSTASKIRKLSTCKQQWPPRPHFSLQPPTWWVCRMCWICICRNTIHTVTGQRLMLTRWADREWDVNVLENTESQRWGRGRGWVVEEEIGERERQSVLTH